MAGDAERQEEFANVETGEVQLTAKAMGEGGLAVCAEQEYPADYCAAGYAEDGSSRDHR